MKTIESPSNKKFKLWKSLKEKKYREKHRLYLIEGKKLYLEAKKSGILIDSIIISEDFQEGIEEDHVYRLKNSLFKDITTMENSEGIICVCPYRNDVKSLGDSILILDGLKDPGNVGTLIRSAEAFGFKDIIPYNQTVDLYNPKVIRAAMGSFFRVNISYKLDFNHLFDQYTVLGLDMKGTNISEIQKEKKIAVIVGSESHGLSDVFRDLRIKQVSIPMEGQVESLNAGVAASILMFFVNNKKQ